MSFKFSSFRKVFGDIKVSHSDVPNLSEIQKISYNDVFLQLGINKTQRKNIGIQGVFSSVFPIIGSSGLLKLEFIEYELCSPKYDVEECKHRDISYTASIKVKLKLTIHQVNSSTKEKEIKAEREQTIYLADLPLMTTSGTFIFNGTERVIVSQMHRSPGVFFDHDNGKMHSSGKFLYNARVIPYRGSWLDIEFDAKGIIYFRIDRRRKLYVSTLLRALGMDSSEILSFFYDFITFERDENGVWFADFLPKAVITHKLKHDLINYETKEVILKTGQKITPKLSKKIASEGLKKVIVFPENFIGKILAHDLLDSSNEKILDINTEITEEVFETITNHNINKIDILNTNYGPYISSTLSVDKNEDLSSAVLDIFRVLRPGELSNADIAKDVFDNIFFNIDRYDLSEVGRIKMNERLGLDVPIDCTTLTKGDILNIIKTLIKIKDGDGEVDDIDHLGNRRIRSVGELMENQFRVGLIRMAKVAVERMGITDLESVMPYDLINPKLLAVVIKEFFGTFRLSQFMDQTNPLSEISHKRRLSALGPGGLSREHAGSEVRDVHYTYAGRICPIETPEGQNIGLINSLAAYAKVNNYGFIESPYYKINNGIVDQSEVVYMSASEEEKYKIAQANTKLSPSGLILDKLVNCKFKGEFISVSPEEVDFIDITPMQILSIAAALIPFLENDDAHRGLMGTNMQRQAVPLIQLSPPLVGTGIENLVAKDSQLMIISDHNGVIEYVDSSKIILRCYEDNDLNKTFLKVYNLLKFRKSNHNTCINQRPVVFEGDYVSKGDVLADGISTANGEIALGKNILVAFLSWYGYNFEDAIIISERIVRDDVYTSIHIEELEIIARDTKLGPEEITRDIPNVNESSLKHLDEVGIVHVGAEVKSGDILVGKITPKSETPATSEEKLLRSIFGEKAGDVKDSSLYAPPGMHGTVIEVKVFSRQGVEKDERSIAIECNQINSLHKSKLVELNIIDNFTISKLNTLLKDQKVVKSSKKQLSNVILTSDIIDSQNLSTLLSIEVADEKINKEKDVLKEYYLKYVKNVDDYFNDKLEKLKIGDDLPQGAIKVIKVFIATKHRLQPGDKMACRHGNKGVISKIVALEDMPFLEDGTPVDIILNPLGLPSRMNIGQILETNLGWASVNLGKKIKRMVNQCCSSEEVETSHIREFLIKIYDNNNEIIEKIKNFSNQELFEFCKSKYQGVHFASPVFDGAKVDDIRRMLNLADVNESGQERLFDGKTGECLDRCVTVGYKYMFKLSHLVYDKIHARSVGPYSLVTQQPLGGKSHFGGQRFGEMEVWALEAYGAAYTLQEMLTIKSDDVKGRIKTYEQIIRGDNEFEPGIPESFNVMTKEIKSLCLNIELINNKKG